MLPERRLEAADRSRALDGSKLSCSLRPRANEVLEAREGGAAAETLLFLKWVEVTRVSSRLPFRRRGKRVNVRRLLVERAAGAEVAVLQSGLLAAEASDMAERASRSKRNWGSWMTAPVVVGSPGGEELREESEAAETVSCRNGVVKGIAVRGRMVAESRRRTDEGREWVL